MSVSEILPKCNLYELCPTLDNLKNCHYFSDYKTIPDNLTRYGIVAELPPLAKNATDEEIKVYETIKTLSIVQLVKSLSITLDEQKQDAAYYTFEFENDYVMDPEIEHSVSLIKLISYI